jgi:hypothetical protein
MIFGDRSANMKLVEQLTLGTLQTAHHGSTSSRIASTQRNHASRSGAIRSPHRREKAAQVELSACASQRLGSAWGLPNATAPHLDSTKVRRPGVQPEGRLYPQLRTCPCTAQIDALCHERTRAPPQMANGIPIRSTRRLGRVTRAVR